MKKILITSIGCAPASAIARNLKYVNDYYLIGIDIQDICVGNFIVNKFLKCPKITDVKYWTFIKNIIKILKIKYIFPIHNNEILEWAKMANELNKLFDCIVFINDIKLVEIANNKMETYNWCIKNKITVPKLCDLNMRPCIIKNINGCGSQGMITLLDNKHVDIKIDNTKNIIQEFIKGTEYTIDIFADIYGNIVNIIPKQRLIIKNGQAFKSVTIFNKELINFAENINKILENKSIINIQVIVEHNTNIIYLIEINARFPTSISLTINAGVHIPKMMIENDFIPKPIKYNLLMIRDYTEYFYQQ